MQSASQEADSAWRLSTAGWIYVACLLAGLLSGSAVAACFLVLAHKASNENDMVSEQRIGIIATSITTAVVIFFLFALVHPPVKTIVAP